MIRSVKCVHSDPMCEPCKKEFTTPYGAMTLPDDIELDNKILDLLEPHYENIGFTREHAKTSVTFRESKELIATYRKKWEEEANILAFKIALHDVDFAERWEQPLAVVKEQMTRRIDILESDLQGENK